MYFLNMWHNYGIRVYKKDYGCINDEYNMVRFDISFYYSTEGRVTEEETKHEIKNGDAESDIVIQKLTSDAHVTNGAHIASAGTAI